jgi:serine/threonine-protein kinase
MGVDGLLSLAPGTTLGRYQLLCPIAKGGMAVVWAARLKGQRGFTKLVAIKTTLPHLETVEFERLFLDEAHLAARVDHPNVCHLFELGEERGILYMVMEWIHGDSLMNLLRAAGQTEALSPTVGARILADACAGLHAAHELRSDEGSSLNVVHRDVSPHNVLITSEGHVKIADFGVARTSNQMHKTKTGDVKGKVAYVAPEHLRGNPFDRRSDIFSLGCVLFEATTGARAFDAEHEANIFFKILESAYPRPGDLVPDYPEGLEAILACALANDPELRFPTAQAMGDALEEWLRAQAVLGGHATTSADVAAIMHARLGDTLEARRGMIREATEAIAEVAPPPQPGAVSGTRQGLGPADLPPSPDDSPRLEAPTPNRRSRPSLPGPDTTRSPGAESLAAMKPERPPAVVLAPPGPPARGPLFWVGVFLTAGVTAAMLGVALARARPADPITAQPQLTNAEHPIPTAPVSAVPVNFPDAPTASSVLAPTTPTTAAAPPLPPIGTNPDTPTAPPSAARPPPQAPAATPAPAVSHANPRGNTASPHSGHQDPPGNPYLRGARPPTPPPPSPRNPYLR